MFGVHRYGENNPMYGKKLSDESKQKISDSLKGRLSGEKNSFYGHHHSDEAKKKMSKKLKGNHWWNNGIIQKYSKDCPEGFVKGMLKND